MDKRGNLLASCRIDATFNASEDDITEVSQHHLTEHPAVEMFMA